MSVLQALQEVYQYFIDAKALRAQDPDAFDRDGWWDPDDDIMDKFEKAINEMKIGRELGPCSQFELTPPLRRLIVNGTYTGNMVKLGKESIKDKNELYRLPYDMGRLTGDELREKSKEISGIRVYADESYAILFTTDSNCDMHIWNVFEMEL